MHCFSLLQGWEEIKITRATGMADVLADVILWLVQLKQCIKIFHDICRKYGLYCVILVCSQNYSSNEEAHTLSK